MIYLSLVFSGTTPMEPIDSFATSLGGCMMKVIPVSPRCYRRARNMDPAEDWQRKNNHFLLNMVIFVRFPSKCRDHYRWNFLKLSIPEVWLLCPAHSRMKLPFYSKWLVRTNHVVHGLIQASSPQKNISPSTAENMGGFFPQNEELWLLVTSHYGFIFSGDVRIWKIIICGWSGILNSHFISIHKTRNLGIFGWKASVLRPQNWLPGS